MRAPFLSEYDPSIEGEGSIDPLGLQPIYERLADRLLPAVTVRMGRPRFVTALTVGAWVCQEWPLDTVAADKVTPPWLVYEWFVVEAFVRSEQVLTAGPRIPGVLKAQRALKDGRPISASAYLKTPTVFGFTGIFRRLARHLRVITEEGRLDDAGYELLGAWSAGQSLAGFLDGANSAGAQLRERLRRAVTQGLEVGHTKRQSQDLCDQIASSLDPAKAGRREQQVLLRLLEDRAGQPETMTHLIGALRKRRSTIDFVDEASFLSGVEKNAPAALRELLSAISAYEVFGRVITDSFDALRYAASEARGAPIGRDDFARLVSADCATALASSIARIRRHERLVQWESSLETTLARFEHANTRDQLYDVLLDHHRCVQDDKPPNGKRTWFESDRGDRIFVRPDYVLTDPPPKGIAHVHEYRIPTFSRFLADLGALS